MSGAYGAKLAAGKLPYGKEKEKFFLYMYLCGTATLIMLHHNDVGYGGFGAGGAGLPGGLGGAGSKPGYPVGTGTCWEEFNTCRLSCS